MPNDVSLFGNVDPLLGKTMGGRWEVIEFLGEGSMSVVYKAQDLQTSEIVVLKILHHHLVANAKSLKRFEQRSRATVALDHHRIAKVMDIHLSGDGQVFLVVEPLKGESLEDLLAKTGHLSVDHAVEIFSQACEGLEYAYTEDVLHRDIKPSNIVLIENGSITDDIKLVDFGIARLLSDENDDVKSSGYITRTREVFGSPMYMSPEQCMGKKLDARSDIYSLGCVMYETLTGKPPFVGKNVLETAYKHMNEAPKPMLSDTSASRTLARLEAVIFKCLAKDPNERYQLVSQLHSDLQILLKATDTAWLNNAFCLKKIAKAKKRDRKKLNVSFEVIVFTAAALLLLSVVSVWAVMFIGGDSKESKGFDNNKLFIQVRKPRPEMPEFGSMEESKRSDVETAKEQHGADSNDYMNALNDFAMLYLKAGKYPEAVDKFNEVLEVARKNQRHRAVASALSQQAAAYFLQGDQQLKEAEQCANEAIDEVEKNRECEQQLLCYPLELLGDIQNRQGDITKAMGTYDRLFQITDEIKLREFEAYIHATVHLADIYRRVGKYADAERMYKLGLDEAEAYQKSENLLMAKAQYGYGLTLEKENKFADAEAALKESLRIQRVIEKQNTTLDKQQTTILMQLEAATKKQIVDCLWHTNWMGALTYRFNDGSKDSKDK